MLIPFMLVASACSLDEVPAAQIIERQRFYSDGGQSEVTILINGRSSAVLGPEAHAVIWIDEECQFASGTIRLSYASFLSAARGGECSMRTNINVRRLSDDERLEISSISEEIRQLDANYFTWENLLTGVEAEYIVGFDADGEVNSIINLGTELFEPTCRSNCGSRSVEILLRKGRVRGTSP